VSLGFSIRLYNYAIMQHSNFRVNVAKASGHLVTHVFLKRSIIYLLIFVAATYKKAILMNKNTYNTVIYNIKQKKNPPKSELQLKKMPKNFSNFFLPNETWDSVWAEKKWWSLEEKYS
jgi:hypothetical protein